MNFLGFDRLLLNLWFKVVHASEHGHRVPDRSSSRLGVCQGLQTGRTSSGTCHCLLLIRQVARCVGIQLTWKTSFFCEDVECLSLLLSSDKIYYVFTCIFSGNWGTIPLMIVPAICNEEGSPFGDASTCNSLGLSYVSLSMAVRSCSS